MDFLLDTYNFMYNTHEHFKARAKLLPEDSGEDKNKQKIKKRKSALKTSRGREKKGPTMKLGFREKIIHETLCTFTLQCVKLALHAVN